MLKPVGENEDTYVSNRSYMKVNKRANSLVKGKKPKFGAGRVRANS